MGNSGAVRYACAFAAAFGLAGCNPPARQSDIDGLRAEVVAANIRIAGLEDRAEQLEAELSATRAMAKVGLNEADGLREALNANARVANENAVKEMTRRGACGSRNVPIYATDGSGRTVGIRNEIIPCTLADLKP